MKGKISLKDFIHEVKEDLREAINDEDPFFYLDGVSLEVSFGLDVEAKAGAKFVVFDIGTKAKAQQTHKITIDLSPFIKVDDGPRGGGGKRVRYSTQAALDRIMAKIEGKSDASRPTMRSPTKKAPTKKRKAKKASVKKRAGSKKTPTKGKI
ncbi:trypco2 family protein [Litorivivens sp.]|uniref:trypco2 family protein n=1 Tax=Litorivivens sp. TaxID=2020868 RepID=UPI00356A4C30